MRARPLGKDALLLECDGPGQVRAAYAEARRRRERGELDCVDVVPGATTVLLDGLRERERAQDSLSDWRLEEPDLDEADVVELSITYDGPDLETVAAHWGLSVEEAVERHRELEHVVAFCGFAPGFAYVSGLPEELAVPRLGEPRSEVPAGAVGLAGRFTGIYPRASPGGWQLIGRTDARLWDLRRTSPALLVPGTRIRFVDG